MPASSTVSFLATKLARVISVPEHSTVLSFNAYPTTDIEVQCDMNQEDLPVAVVDAATSTSPSWTQTLDDERDNDSSSPAISDHTVTNENCYTKEHLEHPYEFH